jgi:thymidylate synthase ThyX
LGYLHSENIDKVGLAREYDEVMKRVGEIEKKIKKKFPYEAQYIVPFAAKKRTIFHFNLREAIYIIELRSRPAGHPEYRRAAQEMWKAINRVHPYFAKHIKVDLS